MKTAFKLFVVIHGLIHLLGFLKGFQLADINQLQNVSKPMGLLWLVATFLFLATSILLIIKKDQWWVLGLSATLLSQILIMTVWQDAKAGTIANVIILIVILLKYASWKFSKKANEDMKLLLAHVPTAEKIITEQMLESLPLPVQKWLKHIGMVGNKEINTVYFKQQGLMRLKPEQKKWYKAKAEQVVTVTQPAFLWKVKMEMMPLVHVAGKDTYLNGTGKMLMKIASLIPVVNVAHNQKVDQSTLQRYLLELPLYPSAALEPYIIWENVDETTAKATMSYEGVTGTAFYFFSAEGELIKISAMRYKGVNEESEPLECIGEIKEHEYFDEIKIPTKIDITWMLKEGAFTWYKLEIYDVQFNRR